jgi:hypothetical protein
LESFPKNINTIFWCVGKKGNFKSLLEVFKKGFIVVLLDYIGGGSLGIQDSPTSLLFQIRRANISA